MLLPWVFSTYLGILFPCYQQVTGVERMVAEKAQMSESWFIAGNAKECKI